MLEKLLYPHSIEKNPNKKIKFITILSDQNSWLNEYIPYLITKLWFEEYEVRWIHNLNDFKKGDICLILSFSKSIKKEKLLFNKRNLVVYENDLKKDKGFSSISWQILEVKNKIINSLIEADLSFHSSEIYNEESINLNKNELVDDWQKLKARKVIFLCTECIKNYPDTPSFNTKTQGLD